MSGRGQTATSATKRRLWSAPVWLTFATLACLLPFLTKPFCIDDPLFLWSARHIQSHPADFFGFLINWDGNTLPMFVITKNPPLACYYIALAAAAVGWSEPALHFAFLLPAVGTIWGTWRVARRLCRQPLGAALAALVTPVFLVSSTNVMCDTLALCCWVWAVDCWMKGLDSTDAQWPRLAVAGLLVAASALTKYFGMSLIPLLAVYTLVRNPRHARALAFLLIPMIVLAGYEWWTSGLYGRGMLLGAAQYASAKHFEVRSLPMWARTLTLMCFLGGCCLPVGGCLPWLVSKRWLLAGAVVACIAAIVVSQAFSMTIDSLRDSPATAWILAFQIALFGLLGLLITTLPLTDVWRRRDAGSILLALWLLGTAAFAGYVNWTCNGRSILPMVPAMGILITRRIEDRAADSANLDVSWTWTLIPTAAIALVVTWADWSQADSGYQAARMIATEFQPDRQRVWFQGHWGFQYYLQAAGGMPVDFQRPEIRPGDYLVIPERIAETIPPRSGTARVVRNLDTPVLPWVTTFEPRAGAGFYAFYGPLPFAFCQTPPKRYVIWQVHDVAQE